MQERQLKIWDVRQHPGDSGFLLDDGRTAVLYDSGFGFTGPALAAAIAEILGPRPLDLILLTHSHYDHALGAAHVRARWPGAKIAAGRRVGEIFARPTALGHMEEMDREIARHCGAAPAPAAPLRVDIPLEEGQTVAAGEMEFRFVALPGHTHCSGGFYMPRRGLLLACETLGVYDGGDIVFPSLLVGYGLALRAMEKAAALGARQLLLPHYGPLAPEKTAWFFEESLRTTRLTAREVGRILAGGGSREEAVAWFEDTFYKGNVPAFYPRRAMLLNTGLMVDLIRQEILGQEP